MSRLAALTVALTLAASLTSADKYTPPGPSQRTYRVTVVSSFETEFIDCYRFDTPNPGELTIDLLSFEVPEDRIITYRHGQLDSVPSDFKAVTPSGRPLAVMF